VADVEEKTIVHWSDEDWEEREYRRTKRRALKITEQDIGRCNRFLFAVLLPEPLIWLILLLQKIDLFSRTKIPIITNIVFTFR